MTTLDGSIRRQPDKTEAKSKRPRQLDRPAVVIVEWNPPTPEQARALKDAMDRFIAAEKRAGRWPKQT